MDRQSSSRGGYSNRNSLAFEPKHPNKQRLLTDRNAYISYLEGLVERADVAMAEAEACGKGLGEIRIRLGDLEEKLRISNETSSNQKQEVEGRFLHLDSVLGDGRFAAEAEMARLRSEMTTIVHDLSQRLDSRVEVLSAHIGEGQSHVVREAQLVCARLADDALAGAEVARRGVEELEQRVEALRADMMASTRAESASLRAAAASALPPRIDVEALAETVERRVGTRLAQQVLQLCEIVRRVLQSQATTQQQLHEQQNPLGGPGIQPRRPSVPATYPSSCYSASRQAAPEQCRAAIDELYRELRQLEERNSMQATRHHF